jgi:hypothetical protein
MTIDATLQALNALTHLFERAATFAGRPRERLLALIEAEEIFFRTHPHHYRALQLIRIAAQLSQPPAGRDSLVPCESRRMTLLTDVIRDGGRCGDLVLGVERRPEDLAFMLWSLAFGTRALMNTQVALSQLGILNGFETVRRFGDVLMDALGWQPLAREWDYERTRARVRGELFPDEVRRLQLAS